MSAISTLHNMEIESQRRLRNKMGLDRYDKCVVCGGTYLILIQWNIKTRSTKRVCNYCGQGYI